MHRLVSRTFGASNKFHNTNVPINEILCVSPPPYYLDCFEKSYPNVPLNQDEGPFCLQFINGIQGTKLSGRKFQCLLDAVVKINKYKKSTIDHAIYIKEFSDGTFYYLTISTYGVINTTNNETEFTELRILF